jgi:hypothetical protein
MQKVTTEVHDLTKYKTTESHASYDASVHVGGVSWSTPCIEVVFRGLQDRLCALIAEHVTKYDSQAFIVGAVAWLSNSKILEALAAAKQRGCLVMLVIQKEDFLRPCCQSGDYKKWLRDAYARLGRVRTYEPGTAHCTSGQARSTALPVPTSLSRMP